MIEGRATPSVAGCIAVRALPITTALVGMSNRGHVLENLSLVGVAPTLRS